MIRVYLLVGALFLAALAWQTHARKQAERKAVAAEVRADRAEAQVEAEQAARKHEQTIAKKASDDYEAELNRIRSSPDIGPVRLCNGPKRLPATASASQAARQPDAPSTPDGQGEDAEDLGPAINDFVEDCEANAAQLNSLQSWIRSR